MTMQALPSAITAKEAEYGLSPVEGEIVDAEVVADTDTDALERGLSSYIKRCWEAAVIAKRPVEDEILRSLRQRAGEYEADELARIQEQGGVPLYMLLTDEKCSSAVAWIKDALFQPDDKPWTIKPTPAPDLNEEAMQAVEAQLAQEIMDAGFMPTPQDVIDRANDLFNAINRHRDEQAEKCAKRMERKIEDQFAEGGFSNALSACLDDMVTLPAGFLKGPIFRKKKALDWGRGGEPAVIDKIVQEWESPAALDIFPSPNSRSIDDGYIIERLPLTRRDLTEYIGVDGFDEEAIREVLDAAEGGSLEDWCNSQLQDTERERLEDRKFKPWDPEARITALVFWGDVSGKMLAEWGMSEADIPDQDLEYQVECWLIKDWVICARLNPDPLGQKPYFKASYREKPGSFWGHGVPYLMRDIQEGCNYVARSLFNNLTIGSGPQVAVDVNRLMAGEGAEGLGPWKIWQYDSSKSAGQSAAPISFFQPDIKAEELSKVYNDWEQKADNKTGIPKYAYGGVTGSQGALSTASGLSQMMANASKALKEVIKHLDLGIIEPAVSRQFVFNMLFEPDPSIKGDLKCVAIGSDALMMREQLQLRRTEALNLVLNPAVLELVQRKGLATFLREYFRGLQLPEEIVPTEEEVARAEMIAQMQQQMAMQQGAMPPGQPQGPQQGGPAGGQNGQAPQQAPNQTDSAGQPMGGQENRLV